MTDEEILKRLAEIEKPLEGNPDDYFWCRTCNEFKGWDPLENWADLGPLIEKYKLCAVFSDGFGTDPDVRANTWEVAPSDGAFRVYGRDESLPHAICLAIIEAHK